MHTHIITAKKKKVKVTKGLAHVPTLGSLQRAPGLPCLRQVQRPAPPGSPHLEFEMGGPGRHLEARSGAITTSMYSHYKTTLFSILYSISAANYFQLAIAGCSCARWRRRLSRMLSRSLRRQKTTFQPMLVVCDKSVDTTKAGRMRIGHGARVYTNLEAARTCILPPSRGGDPANPNP